MTSGTFPAHPGAVPVVAMRGGGALWVPAPPPQANGADEPSSSRAGAARCSGSSFTVL